MKLSNKDLLRLAMDDDDRLDEFTVEPEHYEQRRRPKQKPVPKKPFKGRTNTTADDIW